jgi:hypothetical protein
MKKLVFILSFSCVGIALGQNPNWVWAKSAGGSDYDFANSVCTDHSGSVYMTGYFGSPSITIGSNVLTNSSGGIYHDIFFAKYDENGNVLWAKSAGGSHSDEGYACTADAYGNVYLMGYFYLDTLILDTDTLFNYSMFLAKYDSSGNEIWARGTDAGHPARANGISVDSLGYIYLTGTFSDTVSFDGHVLYGLGEEMFLVKYAPNGNVSWARSAGATYNMEGGIACAADGKGNIYVTGIFENHYMYIGTDTLTNYNAVPCFDSIYCPDIFIARYDSSGNFIWAKSAGGNDFDGVYAITTDTSGSVLIAGSFASSSINFGTYTFNNPFQTLEYTYVAKYDSSGNVLWADAPSSTFGDNACRSIVTDRSGNIYMTGYFDGGSITFGNITLSGISNGDADLYIVKYDASGTAVWAARAGNPNMELQLLRIQISTSREHLWIPSLCNSGVLTSTAMA